MVERLYTPHSVLGAVPAGLHHAWTDPEEQFEWNIMTRRRSFRNLCTMPGEFYSWAITNAAKGKKPLFPDLNTSYANPGKFIDSSLFTGIIFKQALDIGAKFGLSSFVRTASLGFVRSERYRELLASADELLALAHSTTLVDPQTMQSVRQFEQNQASPLHTLYAQSQKACDVMARFARGTLPVTAENMRILHDTLESMAQICDAKADLREHTSEGKQMAASLAHPAGQAILSRAPEQVVHALYAAHNVTQPSQPVRELLQAPKLTRAEDAARYLATLSALVSDAAFEVESDIYRPREQTYLTAAQARQIASTMSGLFNRHQLQLNRKADGSPLRADLPTGIMLKATAQGFELPTPADILSVANAAKVQLIILNPVINRMLAYADAHYAQINGLLAHGTLHIEQNAAPAPKAITATPSTTIAPQSLRNNAAMPASYYASDSPGLSFILRDQARHEMWKLYGRSLPTYIYQAPINLIERLILPNTKGTWEFNSTIVKNEVKAAGWMAFYYPLAESFAGVSGYEATRLGLHATVQKAKQMDAFLAGAFDAAQAADPAFARTLESLKQQDVLSNLTAQYQDVLSKPASELNADETKRLAAYFRELAGTTQSMAQPAYQLLAPHAKTLDDFKAHCHNVLAEGAKTVPDAMQLFTLLRFIQEIADEQILSLEYTDPRNEVLTKESLNRVTGHMMQLIQQNGLALTGHHFTEKGKTHEVICKGQSAGTLVKRTPDGQFAPLSGDEIIDFANQLAAFLRSPQGLDIPTLFAVTKGHLSDQYIPRLEHELLHHATLPALPALTTQPKDAAEQTITPATLHPTLKQKPNQHSYWQEFKQHLSRPEAVDEMTKLRDRYLYVSLFGFPVKIATNILRGDFNKMGAAFSPMSLASTSFAAVANTLAPSYGAVAMREITTLPGQLLISDAREASHLLSAAIGSAGALNPQMKQRFAAASGVNPLLGNESLSHAMEHITPLLLKDPATRSEAENTALSAFAQHHGEALISTTLAALTGPKSANGINTDMHTALAQPAHSVEEAVQLLAWVNALVSVESQSVNVLRYEGISSRLMDDDGLRSLVSHINNRSYTEGFQPQPSAAAGHAILAQQQQPVDAPTLIAFANDIAAKAHSILQQKTQPRSPLVQSQLTQKLTNARQQTMVQAL